MWVNKKLMGAHDYRDYGVFVMKACADIGFFYQLRNREIVNLVASVCPSVHLYIHSVRTLSLNQGVMCLL